MPASSGHSVCWSFYAAIDQALEAHDVRRLRPLHVVSNHVTVRLRLNPRQGQLLLDGMAISDQLRSMYLGAGIQSYFAMCVDVLSLPCILKMAASGAQLSCPQPTASLKDLGVTFVGKGIDKSTGHAMFACMLFVRWIWLAETQCGFWSASIPKHLTITRM